VDTALTQGDPTNIEWSSIKLWYGLQGVSKSSSVLMMNLHLGKK